MLSHVLLGDVGENIPFITFIILNWDIKDAYLILNLIGKQTPGQVVLHLGLNGLFDILGDHYLLGIDIHCNSIVIFLLIEHLLYVKFESSGTVIGQLLHSCQRFLALSIVGDFASRGLVFRSVSYITIIQLIALFTVVVFHEYHCDLVVVGLCDVDHLI